VASNRPTIYEFAGSADAFDRLVAALHERCMADDLLNHPFSHGLNPNHLENLSAYLAEVFGGPTTYSTSLGGHTGMITLHANTGAFQEMSTRFVSCFMLAVDDAHLPNDPDLRRILREYIEAATAEVQYYAPVDGPVPGADPVPMPHWSWDGPTA
jgi:hemoglobin